MSKFLETSCLKHFLLKRQPNFNKFLLKYLLHCRKGKFPPNISIIPMTENLFVSDLFNAYIKTVNQV